LDFESANPTIVKSIKQRDFLNTWLRLFVRTQTLPRIDEFQPARIEEELPDLVFLKVENAKTPRLIIERDGARLMSAFGNSGAGKISTSISGVNSPLSSRRSTMSASNALFPFTPSPMSTTPLAGSSPMNVCCCRSRRAAASRM
jgi:hypothetical protein